MRKLLIAWLTGLSIACTAGGSALGASEGTMTWAANNSIVNEWFDPSIHNASQTAYIVYYAIHDALVKPMPEDTFAPSLAESWSRSDDGLTFDFTLRKGLKFHNGDPLTSEDAKFSFERYHGPASALLKEKVAAVETPDPYHLRIRLKEPWPDFMTYYATNTGAAWVLPKKYIESVGDEGFRQKPIGAGPYRLVSFNPGIEMVVEAVDDYWRKTPNVKRLVFKTVTDGFTRAAMIRNGEADIAIVVPGLLAEELRETPGISIESTSVLFSIWVYPTEQWDPNSPWSNEKVRWAANYAVNRAEINNAEYLGYGTPAGSIIPPNVQYAVETPVPPYDPNKARQLLAEAGYPDGFEGGDLYVPSTYVSVMEAVQNDLQAVGIRVRLRPMERAPYYSGVADKSLRGVLFSLLSSYDNAGTWLEQFVSPGGRSTFGTYPEIVSLMEAQAKELNEQKRADLLKQIQDLVAEKAVFMPVIFPKLLHAAGPRVEESGLGLIVGHPYSAPYEDVELK